MVQEMGEGWVEGVHPDDRQRCLDTYRRAFGARQPFDMEYRLRRADGQYRWVRDAGTAQVDKDGGFLGYLGSCVEIPAPGRATAISPLTSREVQVLALVADGNSTKEVAAVLGISYKTADSHRSRIMEKLGVHETASLVRYAIRQGIVRA
jgi:DNA-binding CsgD family transcriptional regulator